MLVRFLAYAFTGLMAWPCVAQAKPMGLAELYQAALAAHPGLEQARAEAEALAASLSQEAALADPSLGLSGGSKQSPAGQGAVLGASLSQAFSFPGKRSARLRLAELQWQAATLKVNAAEASLLKELLTAAADHAAADELWRQILERQKRLEPVRATLATQTFASPQQKADRAVIEARLRNLEAEQSHLLAEVSATAEVLFGLAGLEGGGQGLDWELPAFGQTVDKGVPAAEAVEKGNPELALARLELEQAAVATELAGMAGLPDPEISLAYGREQAGEEEQSLVAGLSVPLPVFSRNQHGRKAAESGAKAAKARVASLSRTLQAGLRALARRLEGLAASAAAFSTDALGRLESQLAEAERELRRGRLPLLSYLELEDEAARTREAALAALAETFRSLAQAHSLAGGTSVPAAWSR